LQIVGFATMPGVFQSAIKYLQSTVATVALTHPRGWSLFPTGSGRESLVAVSFR
jgi:hypothetical protein